MQRNSVFTRTRFELRPGIILNEADGSITQLEMSPNLYFSERQPSALSVAALLLGDPLQHNDVITRALSWICSGRWSASKAIG
jgi:hypothetical protein